MYNSFQKKKIYLLLTGFILLIIYSVYYYRTDVLNLDTLKILGFFALVQLVYIIWSWHKLTGSYFDAYLVFMYACYAFNLGQPILEVFDAVAPLRSIITHYHLKLDDYCIATYISTIFLISFHFGALFSCKASVGKAYYYISKDRHILQAKAIFKVAAIFAIISFPGYIYNTIVNMILSATYGYGAIYMENTGRIKIFQLIGEFYAPAMICLYFASEIFNKNKRLIVSIILITILFPPLFIGGRSNAMIILAVLGIVYTYFHKIKTKQVILLGLCGYVALVVFSAIAGNRGAKDRSFESFTTIDDEKGNPALFTLSEMGGSIQPLIHCINIIPNNQDYRYGESYIYATTTVIPNLGFWDVHPATKNSNLGNWLKDYLGISYGPGFSIVAEAYYNFGYWGFLMMIILGFLFTKLFANVNRINVWNNPIKFILAIVLLWLTIKMVRNSFEFAVRALVYYYLPMLYFMNLQYKKYLIKLKK